MPIGPLLLPKSGTPAATFSPWRKWVSSPVFEDFLGIGQKIPYGEPTGETPWTSGPEYITLSFFCFVPLWSGRTYQYEDLRPSGSTIDEFWTKSPNLNSFYCTRTVTRYKVVVVHKWIAHELLCGRTYHWYQLPSTGSPCCWYTQVSVYQS